MGEVARISRRELSSSSTPVDEHGTITRAEGPLFVVETDTEERRARRATSCLLEPRAGDLVRITTLVNGQSYVLDILEREAQTGGRLVVDGPLQIHSSSEIALVAPGAVQIVSAEKVSAVAPTIVVRAADGHVALDRLSYVGTFLRAKVEQAKVFGQTLESIVDRVSLRAKRSYRTIEETDQVRADRVDYAARSAISLKGATASLIGTELAKIDGDQIHVG